MLAAGPLTPGLIAAPLPENPTASEIGRFFNLSPPPQHRPRSENRSSPTRRIYFMTAVSQPGKKLLNPKKAASRWKRIAATIAIVGCYASFVCGLGLSDTDWRTGSKPYSSNMLWSFADALVADLFGVVGSKPLTSKNTRHFPPMTRPKADNHKPDPKPTQHTHNVHSADGERLLPHLSPKTRPKAHNTPNAHKVELEPTQNVHKKQCAYYTSATHTTKGIDKTRRDSSVSRVLFPPDTAILRNSQR